MGIVISQKTKPQVCTTLKTIEPKTNDGAQKAFLKYNDLLYHLLKMILCLTRHMHILQALLVFEIFPYINEFSFVKHTRGVVGQYGIIRAS